MKNLRNLEESVIEFSLFSLLLCSLLSVVTGKRQKNTHLK